MDKPATVANRAPRAVDSARACPRCGEPMIERQCKIVCTNCGSYHDCSDP